MRWSKLKQLTEQRMAPALNGRVEVHSTRYYSGEGRGWITLDRCEIADFSTLGFAVRAYHRATESAGTDYRNDDPARRRAWYDARNAAADALHDEGDLMQGEFHHALWTSLSLSIDDALQSDVILIRALTMLDSRLGKRRLRTLELREDEHPLVRRFYALRCEAEGITHP